MKYFIDTEFLEGTQNTWFIKTKPTIDLISIGIVAEDGREYYAISKEFNLKEAWDRFETGIDRSNNKRLKEYWLRDNVLKTIYIDKIHDDMRNYIPFTYNGMKSIIKRFGKTNKQIASEIIKFCNKSESIIDTEFYNSPHMYADAQIRKANGEIVKHVQLNSTPIFYGYYADYDWVVFCWLFGKMIDLPNGFPMYCIDLKQELDSKVTTLRNRTDATKVKVADWDVYLRSFTRDPKYPKQVNEHNALADARWTKQLYDYLNTI